MREDIHSGCTTVALYRMNCSFDVPVTQNPVNQFHLLRLLLRVEFRGMCMSASPAAPGYDPFALAFVVCSGCPRLAYSDSHCYDIWPFGVNTILNLKHIQIRSGFFVLSKLNEGRRSRATLTGVKQRQGEKDARRCIDFRLRIV